MILPILFYSQLLFIVNIITTYIIDVYPVEYIDVTPIPWRGIEPVIYPAKYQTFNFSKSFKLPNYHLEIVLF